MGKIKIFDKTNEFQDLKIGTDYLEIDNVRYVGLSEEQWNNIECEEIDIVGERNKAIVDAEKSKNIPDKVVALQEENLDIILIATGLFEQNLKLSEENELLKAKDLEKEQQILDIIEVLTSVYESTLA